MLAKGCECRKNRRAGPILRGRLPVSSSRRGIVFSPFLTQKNIRCVGWFRSVWESHWLRSAVCPSRVRARRREAPPPLVNIFPRFLRSAVCPGRVSRRHEAPPPLVNIFPRFLRSAVCPSRVQSQRREAPPGRRLLLSDFCSATSAGPKFVGFPPKWRVGRTSRSVRLLRARLRRAPFSFSRAFAARSATRARTNAF